MNTKTIRNKGLNLFLFFSLALTFSSCNYMPTLHNTPMLSKAGEVQISLMDENFIMFDLQTAVGVTNHVGLMVNSRFSYLMFEDIKSSILSAEKGLGYYTGSGFEIYGGAGKSWYKPVDENEEESGHFNTFFIQPAYGGTRPIFFQSAFGGARPKTSFFNSEAQSIVALRFSGVNHMGKTHMFFEPGFVGKIGWNWVRIVTNFGFSIYMGNRKELSWSYNPFLFGIGVQLSIGRK